MSRFIINSIFFAVESKNSTFFAIQFFCDLSSTFLDFAVCSDLSDCWKTNACRSCRSSFFNLLILISIVTIMMSDSVCICFAIRSKCDNTLFENCSCVDIADIDDVMFDQIMNIFSVIELSFLICLIDAKDIRIDLFSVDTDVENCDVTFSNSLNFWKLRRNSAMFVKNCLIVARIRVLSIIQSDEKEEFKFKSIELDLICLVSNLTMIDRNRVVFTNVKIFYNSFEMFDANFFWKISSWNAIVQRLSLKIIKADDNKCLLKNKIDQWKFHEKRFEEKNIKSTNKFVLR